MMSVLQPGRVSGGEMGEKRCVVSVRSTPGVVPAGGATHAAADRDALFFAFRR